MSKDLKIFNDSYFMDWLKIIKQRIKQSQLKAAVRVNTEMLQLYWDIGREIVQRDVESRWGKYMKRFYQFYSMDYEIGQQLVDQLEKNI